MPANATAHGATVVTGGSRGIGLCLAQRFAAAGRDIVLVARDPESLERAKASIQTQTPVQVTCIAADLSVPGAAQEVCATLARAGLAVDTLVNCAGVGSFGRLVEVDPVRLTQSLQVNVIAPTELARAMLPAMLARGRGGILNVASLAGLHPLPGAVVYSAAKSYMIALTRGLAEEARG
jgi:short-subunit dehydrogenase